MDLEFTRRVLTAAADIAEYVLAYRGGEAADAQRQWQVETLERIVTGKLFF
jgi:hypothetical protein